jgi:RHS repeat-associated protein
LIVSNRRAAFLFSLLALISTTAFASIAKPAIMGRHDSRGLLTTEKQPDGGLNSFAYDATGALHQYQDPTAQTTTDVNDQLGRPLTRTYADKTIETYVWEGSRLTARQGRKQLYQYDAGSGRLSDVVDGASSSTKLDHFEYDAAGRLRLHLTNDPNGGVLRQIIHGGLGYDDPIEVTAVGSTGTLTRFYPTYDEVGTGSLQAVMGASGQLVARNVPTDAYGNDRLELDGPAIDGITLEATGGGVDVTLHATEQLTESTVATGMRLAALDSNGAVVRTATATAALVAGDPYAARITLTSLEWNALTDPSPTSTSGLAAQSLSVAATSTLRARGWSAEVPFMPAPDWARASLPIFATAALPLEVRESLPSLADWLAAIPPSGDNTRPLYKIVILALLAQPSAGATTPINTLLAARFQAQPFADPFTGKNYVRERWYDPERGSWLSPDPMGNRDSANLYSFCAGDPVNGRDQSGEYQADVHAGLTFKLALLAGFGPRQAERIALANVDVDLDPATDPVKNALAGNWGPVYDMHFLIAPGDKKVVPANQAATFRVRSAATFTAFGRALHTFQDTYSHSEAYPGNIIAQSQSGDAADVLRWARWTGEIKDPEHGIMHQVLRTPNGNLDAVEASREADYTWLRPDLAWQMSVRVFEEMLSFRMRSGSLTAVEAEQRRVTLQRLKPKFYEFFSAKTIPAKIQSLRSLAGERAVDLVPWNDVTLAKH